MSKKTFNNIDELYKHMKENVGDLIEKGEKIDIECPICKKDTVAIFIDKSLVKCNECGTELNVEFDVK
ncbi:hypothetical protein [Clostridium paraputrificum]|uniref:hypothetical protein n=1 Tax=Clostridium paraputrificum TaxID=29363 RepID=UPI001B3C4C8E|nr:hypothetical protein [Clostridium paraputrificum]DAE48837.1 MAG TPA: DNA-directed RNA polymerase [Caudoviricetes sp.]